MSFVRADVRNVAIIAHVDHGKTTLVDAMLRQSGALGQGSEAGERVLDSLALERERGITILAKTTAVTYQGTVIHIVDTPGHADFGGEVERILSMVDGCLLLVDAVEGPMPQTRYVLRKALEARLRPVVVINKIDRQGARPEAVAEQVWDLLLELSPDEDVLESPLLYASARQGVAHRELGDDSRSLAPLFAAILSHVPPPVGDPDGPLQLMVTTLDHDAYLGRLAIGRVAQGRLRAGEEVGISRRDGTLARARVSRILVPRGLSREAVPEATVGDIVLVAGLPDVTVGETLTDPERPAPLPVLRVDEPTVVMTFRVNQGPFAGQEGLYVTSRHLRERLLREQEKSVSLRVEETDSPEAFRVAGRGELHLAVLIETLRREGYELCVSMPEVVLRRQGDTVLEPLELVWVEVPHDTLGRVMDLAGARRGELLRVTDTGHGLVRMEWTLPARGLFGLRSQLLQETRGQATFHHVFAGYGPYRGPVPRRTRGSLVAAETGEVTAYALHALEDRGVFFVTPGTRVYQGMVVGEHTRETDLDVNVCRRKHVTNVRSSTQEEGIRLAPPRRMSLEEAVAFLAEDEMLEVTPQSLRIRKAVLDPAARSRRGRRARQEGTEAAGAPSPSLAAWETRP